jgi:hypothetical protein
MIVDEVQDCQIVDEVQADAEGVGTSRSTRWASDRRWLGRSNLAYESQNQLVVGTSR